VIANDARQDRDPKRLEDIADAGAERVYRASLERNGDGSASITSASVNRNPSEYNGTDDAYDRILLCYLIERLLAGRDVPFSIPTSKVSPPGAFQHHVAGSGNREIVVPPAPPQRNS